MQNTSFSEFDTRANEANGPNLLFAHSTEESNAALALGYRFLGVGRNETGGPVQVFKRFEMPEPPPGTPPEADVAWRIAMMDLDPIKKD